MEWKKEYYIKKYLCFYLHTNHTKQRQYATKKKTIQNKWKPPRNKNSKSNNKIQNNQPIQHTKNIKQITEEDIDKRTNLLKKESKYLLTKTDVHFFYMANVIDHVSLVYYRGLYVLKIGYNNIFWI